MRATHPPVRLLSLLSVLLLLAACASGAPKGVRIGEPREGLLDSYDGVKYPVPVAFRLTGARMVNGTARWNEAPVVSQIDALHVEEFLFPVGEMIERTTREALAGPFERVLSGREAPVRIEARMGDFQLAHSGRGSNAEVRVDVRYRILDERGRLLQKIRHEGIARSHFDGSRAPDALWVALYEVAAKLRRSLAESSDLAALVERESPPSVAAVSREPSALPPLAPPPERARARYGAGYERKVAAVIGINDYVSWPALEGATPDARAVAEALRESDFEVVEIYDGEATRGRILQVLGEDLPETVNEETLAVVFFAGHGHTETLANGEKRGYIIPVDGDTQRVYSTSISMKEIQDLSNRLPAKHVYYAMDSCYSGLGFTRGIAVSPKIDRYFEKVTSKRVVQMITAGQEGEQAIERGGRGVFTSYLIEALAGDADYNGDGYVTASEIGAFVPSAVTQATGGRQTPRFGTLEGAGEVVFDLR